MSYVTKRADSTVYQFVYRTPAKVLAKLKGKPILISFSYIAEENPYTIRPVVGEKIKFSLKTSDKHVALARELEALRQIEDYFNAANSNEVELSHRDLVRMSRAIYEAYLEIHQEEPGLPRQLAEHKALSRAISEGRIKSLHPLRMGEINGTTAKELFGEDLTVGVNAFPQGEPDRAALETRFGELADYLLARYHIAVDDATRGRLLLQCAAASIDAGWRLKENAAGDYGPDKRIERFGEPFVAPKQPQALGTLPAASKTSLMAILEAWWTEAKATGLKPSTYESYSNAVAGFVRYLGHDDAAKVTADNVIGFKDHRLAQINPRSGKPISPRTVKGSDLSGLKTVFGWAVANRKVATNPTIGITVKVGKKRVNRKKGFEDAEATAILAAADALTKGQEQPKTFEAKRWVPWLCCYTGARVGEMAQLRKEDVRKDGEHWVLRITPEAGTVKTDEARDVVLHSHLVEKGFPAFVADAKAGHLFITPNRKTNDVLGPLQGITNRLGEQARKIVSDPEVKPNHGWRHRFKTIARNVGIDPRVMDAIQGHAGRTAGDDYGDVTVAAMAFALAKFPRQGLT
jgi:site-specific recombinase XerD